jgi:hypothetical protein
MGPALVPAGSHGHVLHADRPWAVYMDTLWGNHVLCLGCDRMPEENQAQITRRRTVSFIEPYGWNEFSNGLRTLGVAICLASAASAVLVGLGIVIVVRRGKKVR